ncbi:MAG: translocation/assembly module TamB domain-containing protein [Acidobacteriota bacterium]
MGDLVQGFFRRQRLQVVDVDERLAAITLDVDVQIPDGVEVDNNVAVATGSAELVLRGTPTRPLLFGEAELDAGGRLQYGGIDYRLERGRLRFDEPTQIDPELDVVATTQVREYDVTLTLSGTASRLDAQLRSEPPLPDVEVFQLLASGGTREVDLTPPAARRRQSRGQEDLSGSTSAADWLYGQATSTVGQRWRDLFGLDTFRVDPLTTGGDTVGTARVTVGKQLSRDVLVTYSADPASTEEQRLQVEWRLGDGLVLVLTQNGDGSYAADARWEQTFP